MPTGLVVFQRKTKGGELYKTNYSKVLTNEHIEMYVPGVKVCLEAQPHCLT